MKKYGKKSDPDPDWEPRKFSRSEYCNRLPWWCGKSLKQAIRHRKEQEMQKREET